MGLMGVLADTVLAGGGEVFGVIPRGLFRQEVPHRGLTQLHEVASMHEHNPMNLLDRFAAYTPTAKVAKWTKLPPER